MLILPLFLTFVPEPAHTFLLLLFQALGAVDYLELSQHFDSVILRNIPKMTLKHKSEAKRFIVLVDTFYDNKVS